MPDKIDFVLDLIRKSVLKKFVKYLEDTDETYEIKSFPDNF